MKRIPLTRNQYTLVDDEDYSRLAKHKWWVCQAASGTFYAVRAEKDLSKKRCLTCGHLPRRQKLVSMARLILDISDPKIWVDHKDGNPLNNQKSNLRICNRFQNARNQQKKNMKHRALKRSLYKGVSWHGQQDKWKVDITANRKRVYIGLFDNEIDAALAYNKAAIKYHGEFAKLNVIK